jgi:hypothetical protein
VQKLPKNVPLTPSTHPDADVVKIRPRDGGIGGKEIGQGGDGGPGLDRPPVMSDKMNGLARTDLPNNGGKIVHKL